jgi:hypothetical protein
MAVGSIGTEKSLRRDSDGRSTPNDASYGESSVHRDGLGRRVFDSFKRNPNTFLTPKGTMGVDSNAFDVESAVQNTAASPLARTLKGRHLQMIAIGGSIGMCGVVAFETGLTIVGTGDCANTGVRYGPLCRVGQCAVQRRTGLAVNRLLFGRYHAVQHRPRTGRDGGSLPRGWVFLGLLDTLPRPGLGVRHGMEVYASPCPVRRTLTDQM